MEKKIVILGNEERTYNELRARALKIQKENGYSNEQMANLFKKFVDIFSEVREEMQRQIVGLRILLFNSRNTRYVRCLR